MPESNEGKRGGVVQPSTEFPVRCEPEGSGRSGCGVSMGVVTGEDLSC